MPSNISTMFRSEPEEQSASNDKLHELYWNRAELKKEFALLRNEKYELQQRVKEEQGATARIQQKLEHLENLLLDREWVYSVAAFYQLRRLNSHCHGKLGRFAEQLKQQHEERIHSEALAGWNQQRNATASKIESRVNDLRVEAQQLEDQLQADRHRLLTMGGLQKLFRGRKLAAAIDATSERIKAGQMEEQSLLTDLTRNQVLEPPSHQGLSVAAKRSINFMILSYLQQLYLNYAEDKLAELARESSEKSVGAVNYGSKRDCDAIIACLQRRRKALEGVGDSAGLLKRRAGLIAKEAVFRHDEDAVPIAASVSTLFAIDADGAVVKKDGNLLGENYFGVTRVLSR